MPLVRCPENPIVVPGKYPWRASNVFNPAVIRDQGTFYMVERAAGGLRPFHCYLGLLKSDDGIHFTHVQDTPVFTPADLGFPFGSIQYPRLVKIDDTFYLTYALRPSSYGYAPTGTGKPEEIRYTFPAPHGKPENFLTRSGILESKDLVHWTQVAYTTPFDINDRDNVLFPEKINGKFALLRRPEPPLDGKRFPGAPPSDQAGIWICYSDDLKTWSTPKLVATAVTGWEYKKIGGSAPPIKTDAGWLTLYHGVDAANIYRCGVMILDAENPARVVARAKSFILEPQEYYEKFGLYIPNVVFPTGNVVVNGVVYIYYGVTDTAICLATVPLAELIDFALKGE
jgi:predicted GH43/DUF377 family glycosyl hydrolase